MNKTKDIKESRADYVKRIVNQSRKTDTAVTKLSRELYLSKRTIYRDLEK